MVEMPRNHKPLAADDAPNACMLIFYVCHWILFYARKVYMHTSMLFIYECECISIHHLVLIECIASSSKYETLTNSFGLFGR